MAPTSSTKVHYLVLCSYPYPLSAPFDYVPFWSMTLGVFFPILVFLFLDIVCATTKITTTHGNSHTHHMVVI